MLEATRIRTAIGPSQAWYTENLRYYYLILPTVDGSLSRRFGFLITALCLFTAVFIMLRRKRVPGVARGPAWRLMGVIFGTMFFLMFTPTKWVHHFGLFAAVGAAMAALTTVLVSPAVLRWSRNRMAFLAAVMFLLALCFATTNGWWYVSSYGVPFNNAMPKIGGISVSTIFFALFAIDRAVCGLAALRRPRPRRGRTGARADRRADSARRRLHGAGVRRVDGRSASCGSTPPTPTARRTCGPSPAAAGWPTTCSSSPTPTPASWRRCPATTARWARWAASNPVGFTPNGVPDHTVAEAIVMHPNQPGTDYDWDAPTKLKTAGINGSTVPLPYGLDPARVPVAGSYTDGPQQQSKLASAWYQLPPADDGHPLVVVTAAGKIAGNSVLHGHTDGQTVVLEYGRPGPDGDAGAGRAAGARRSVRRAAQGVAQPALPPVRDPRRRRRGPGGRRGSVADAGATGSRSRRRGCPSCARCRSTSGRRSRC